MKPICAIVMSFAALLFAGSALAQSSVFLEELTSPEVQAAVKAGKTTILIPIGGTEQNGDRMVLGKHNVRARALAEAIARRLGDALVAPVIAYVPEGAIDPPQGHMRQAGTITIPEDAFERTLESAAKSFIKHGFNAVVLLGDHGGYHRSLQRVASHMNVKRKIPVIVVPAEYYRELEHAGVDDIALALAIDPRIVRDAHGANVERGRVARDEIVGATADAIRRTLAR